MTISPNPFQYGMSNKKKLEKRELKKNNAIRNKN